MILKKITSICCLIFAAVIFINAAYKGEKDPLHKRTFNIGIVEVKDGQPGKKSLKDEFAFKDGKLMSNYLKDKFAYSWIKYRINKDSLFVDSLDVEIRRLEVEATTTDEKNTTLTINMVIENWDIEGYIKMTKNDKLKKYYDITGFEKGGKPKKEKKRKNEPVVGEEG
jgi:hypothetical protein